MFRIHLLAAYLVSCLTLCGSPLQQAWNFEGFTTRGDWKTSGAATRIHGTVEFTSDKIRFKSNIGDFSRTASLSSFEFNEVFSQDVQIGGFTVEDAVIRKTQARLSQVDEETWVLTYGKTGYRTVSGGEFIGASLLDNYEWIGVVLTKRPVSSSIHPFSDPNLWLDSFKGGYIEMEDSSGTDPISTDQGSERIQIDQQEGRFHLVGNDDRLPLNEGSELKELAFREVNQDRELLYVDQWLGENPDGSSKVIGSTHHWIRSASDTVKLIHLGAGRIFWFQDYAELGDTIHKDLQGAKVGETLSYVFSVEMACGVFASPNAAIVPEIQNTAQSFAKADYTGESARLWGDVRVIRGGKEFPLTIGAWVREGDVVKTGPKSFVKFIFIDRSQMNIGPESEMKIERFTGKDSGIIDFVKGKIRSQVTKDYLQMQETNKTKLFIKTRNCAIGVRGTEFQVTHTISQGIGTTSIQMFEGAVDVVDADDGKLTVVRNQQQLTLTGPATREMLNRPEIVVFNGKGTDLTSGSATQRFGQVITGKSEKRSFLVRNVGLAILKDLRPTIEGPHAGDFRIVSQPGPNMGVGGEARLTVEFAPRGVGARTARLRMANSDVDEDPFVISLTGVGISESPALVVEWPPGTTVSSGVSRKFGSVSVGGKSRPRSVTLRNFGALPLEGVKVGFSGVHKEDFVRTSVPTLIRPGESVSFKVSFQPRKEGTRSATLGILTNDPSNPSFVVRLNGEGMRN